MNAKTEYLHIRIKPEQKKILLRLADKAQLTLSAYVLNQLLGNASEQVRKEIENNIKNLK